MMKIRRNVFIVFCTAIILCLSAFATSNTASTTDTMSLQEAESYAYMDLSSAPKALQSKILEARNQIIFNESWVADGCSGGIFDVETGEVIRELPEFSELFPTWDMPIYATEAQPEIPTVSPLYTPTHLIFSDDVYLDNPDEDTNTPPFYTFNTSPLAVNEPKTVSVVALEYQPQIESFNYGISNATTGESVAFGSRLEPGHGIFGYFPKNTRCAVRASTFSSPGYALMGVYCEYVMDAV